ncbi:valine--tRNA ligase [Elioraea thermophila]|uniref:valine--tRNA ligase n=1 Tax=Elioraea thermophila TaxID=2185104 RepID=UPI000DF179B2|nr:valine--tRNA ligase [Elioraea thermophila]
MTDKTFPHAEVEPRLYAAWERSGLFGAKPNSTARPYCIVIPPPNVTGSLHMGHALNNTLQDVLIRWRRMSGDDVLWMPGTDHAGIATQMVVERMLAAEGTSRQALGREAFLERVWTWREQSGGTITRQLRRLGCSLDWPRERFTMDAGLSRAVTEVFVRLYREGLIYRAKRLVNWDPKFHSAISDLEVENREVKGNLWYIRYPIDGEDGRFIVVATTRPETMLGDTAVAVHPEDERWKDLIGRHAILPLVGRRIPIVADAYSDPTKGSGAVKITPAHDFNDFEVGRRHGLEAINILDRDARLLDGPPVPEPYRGLDRFEARKRIVADLEALGLIEKVEPHTHMVPHGDRSGVVIEPYLTDQWFVDAKTLAGPAIAAVEAGRTRFVPKQWENTYFAWLRAIEPWCISRQLWWGHQIPAWYAPDGAIFVAHDEAEAKRLAAEAYGHEVALERDPDVLDTWFSSALWPFSTLGWPDKTPELARYYPGEVLVTGFDIIFFWVARMMMMGLHMMGEVPFRTVYVHALVRDERGQKMSKSKGNVIDPLDLIDTFGADALRFTLCAMAAQGRDIKLSTARVEGYRNFGTKLWNAARFCRMNLCVAPVGWDPASARATLNRWILGRLAEAARHATEALEQFRFDAYAGGLYQFVWGTFCDWYLELAKPALAEEGALREETRATAGFVLDVILALLHPVMPFITEEIWHLQADRGPGPCEGRRTLMVEPWPDAATLPRDPAAEAEVDWVVRLVSEVRAIRAETNVPPARAIPLFLKDAYGTTLDRLARWKEPILRLARLSDVSPLAGEVPKGSAQAVLDEATLVLPLAEVIDLEAERARLAREVARHAEEIARLDAKLANPAFVSRAAEEVVEESRERRAAAAEAKARLEAALARLAG